MPHKSSHRPSRAGKPPSETSSPALPAPTEERFALAVGPRVSATRPEDGFRNVELSFAELYALLTTRRVRAAKDGAYFTRPMGGDGHRSDSNAGAWRLVPIDIDDLQPEDLEEARAYLAKSNLRGFTISTHNHSADGPRVRLIVIASRPITAAEHAFMHRALSQRVPFKCDPSMAKPSQPIYAPSCPEETTELAFADYHDGEPLDVDRLLDACRAEVEEEAQRKAQRAAGAVSSGVRQPGGLIEFFDQHYDLRALLEARGYTRKGRDRYIAPGSKSRRAAVVLYDDPPPPRLISFHDAGHDPLARRSKLDQALLLDAFGAFCALEHGDDFKAALNAALEWAKTQGWADVTQPAHTDTTWEQPAPLLAKHSPAPYPLDALPDLIRSAVEEVRVFIQAPVSLVAGSALATLSASAQALYNVQRADKLTGPIGLFQLMIADSGERKSTCDGFFTPSIRHYEAREALAKGPDLQAYRAAAASWDATRAGLLNAIREHAKNSKSAAAQESQLQKLEAAKPQEPRVPKILLGDATSEHLAFFLAHRWPSGAVISSEGGLIFGSHSMGSDAIMRNLALYNVLWDGGQHEVGRRTSESFTVRGARLTVGLQVQEPTLRVFFANSDELARGTGFMARFLIAWPESTQGYRPFRDPPKHWPALAAFNQRIDDILSIDPTLDRDGALVPKMLMLSPDAKAAWRDFHDGIEKELRIGGALYDIRDVASKAADNCARLAALFHIFDMGKNPPKGSASRYISADHMKAASRIVRWHVNESRRFFGELALPAEIVNAVKLDVWLLAYCRRNGTHMVPIKDVQQLGPGPLRRREVLERTVSELDDLNRARLVRDGRRKMIAVNPLLLKTQ